MLDHSCVSHDANPFLTLYLCNLRTQKALEYFLERPTFPHLNPIGSEKHQKMEIFPPKLELVPEYV
jgi:hypothetical protein